MYVYEERKKVGKTEDWREGGERKRESERGRGRERERGRERGRERERGGGGGEREKEMRFISIRELLIVGVILFSYQVYNNYII